MSTNPYENIFERAYRAPLPPRERNPFLDYKYDLADNPDDDEEPGKELPEQGLLAKTMSYLEPVTRPLQALAGGVSSAVNLGRGLIEGDPLKHFTLTPEGAKGNVLGDIAGATGFAKPRVSQTSAADLALAGIGQIPSLVTGDYDVRRPVESYIPGQGPGDTPEIRKGWAAANPWAAGAEAVGTPLARMGMQMGTDPLMGGMESLSAMAGPGKAALEALESGVLSPEAASAAMKTLQNARRAQMVNRGLGATFVPGMALGAVEHVQRALQAGREKGYLSPEALGAGSEALSSGIMAGFGAYHGLTPGELRAPGAPREALNRDFADLGFGMGPDQEGPVRPPPPSPPRPPAQAPNVWPGTPPPGFEPQRFTGVQPDELVPPTDLGEIPPFPGFGEAPPQPHVPLSPDWQEPHAPLSPDWQDPHAALSPDWQQPHGELPPGWMEPPAQTPHPRDAAEAAMLTSKGVLAAEKNTANLEKRVQFYDNRGWTQAAAATRAELQRRAGGPTLPGLAQEGGSAVVAPAPSIPSGAPPMVAEPPAVPEQPGQVVPFHETEPDWAVLQRLGWTPEQLALVDPARIPDIIANEEPPAYAPSPNRAPATNLGGRQQDTRHMNLDLAERQASLLGGEANPFAPPQAEMAWPDLVNEPGQGKIQAEPRRTAAGLSLGHLPTDVLPEHLQKEGSDLASKLAKQSQGAEINPDNVPEHLRPHAKAILDEAALESGAIQQGRDFLAEMGTRHGRKGKPGIETKSTSQPGTYDVVQRGPNGKIVGAFSVHDGNLLMVAGGKPMDSPVSARPLFEAMTKLGVARNDILTILGIKARRNHEARAKVEGDERLQRGDGTRRPEEHHGRVPETAPGVLERSETEPGSAVGAEAAHQGAGRPDEAQAESPLSGREAPERAGAPGAERPAYRSGDQGGPVEAPGGAGPQTSRTGPSAEVVKARVHAKAEDLGLDINAPKFRQWSKEATGKEHLDDMTAPELSKILETLNRDPKAFGRRAPEKLVTKDRDELGTPILPGQEDWSPEKRKAVRDYTQYLADELDRMERAEPTGPRYNKERGFSGVRSKTRGTPFEDLGASPSKIKKALKRDEGNRLELEALDAVHRSGDWQEPEEAADYRDAVEPEEGGDTSFNPEEYENAPKYSVRRPAPGQRGLPGIGEDVAPKEEKPERPKARQANLFGEGAMLQGTERKGTEGREAGGKLFTQERDARERAEEKAQGGIKYATAYHGTPHDFDEGFTTQKIGTGEGAQAYGWGMYFAGNKDVADYYRQKLSPRTWTHKGKEISREDETAYIARALADVRPEGRSPEAIQAALDKEIKGLRDHARFAENAYGKDTAQSYLDKADTLAKLDPANLSLRQGRLYTVDLTPKEHEYLDWDKPLGEQSEQVQKALESVGIAVNTSKLSDAQLMARANRYFRSKQAQAHWREDIGMRERIRDGYKAFEEGPKPFREWVKRQPASSFIMEKMLGPAGVGEVEGTGSSVYARIRSNNGGDAEKASKALLAAGIPGIKYTDALSRGPGSAYDVRWSPDGTKAEVRDKSGTVVKTFDSFREADKWVEDQPQSKTHNYVIFDDRFVSTKEKYAAAKQNEQGFFSQLRRAMDETKQGAQVGKPITIERVRASLPGLDFETQEDGTHVATLRGGGELRVTPVGEIEVTNRQALAESAKAGGVDGEGKPVGSYQKIGQDGVIQIAKEAPAGTEHHEAFHFFFDRALSDKEKAAVLEKYGDEESAAYAYQDWTPKTVNSWFSKIMSYAKRLYHAFKPTWESTFEEARSGRAGSRISEAQGVEAPARFSSDSPEGHVKDLTALHNITAEELMKADKIGGMPMPSIAITRGKQHEGYGGITLIGDRNLVDPKIRDNETHPHDAYTGRFPKTEWKLKRGAVKDKFMEQFPRRKEFGELGSDLWDALDEGPDRAFQEARRSSALMSAFLAEKGIKVDPVIIPKRQDYPYLSADPKLQAWREANPHAFNELRPDTPEWAEFSKLVEDATDRAQEAKDPELNADLRAARRKSMFDEDGQLHFNRASRIWDNLDATLNKTTELDRYAAEENAKKQLKGHEAEYEEWMRKKIAPLYEGEFLRLGRKRVPVTLDNLVEVMRRAGGAGTESNMTFGPGQARAAGGRAFPSVEAMHRAKEKLVDAKTFKEWKDANDKVQERMRTALLPSFDGGTWEGLDSVYKAMAQYLKGSPSHGPFEGGFVDRQDATIRRVLSRNGFRNVPRSAIEMFRTVGESIMDAPTEYFESKPKRGVGLHEWAGAAIPEDTPQHVREMLDRRGIPYETYKGSDSPEGYQDRQRAVDKLLADAQAKGREVKYATAPPGRPTQGTLPFAGQPAKKKATLHQQLLEGFKGNILSGIGTHGVNIGSVGVDTGYRMYETAISGVVDRMMGGNRTRFSGATKAELKGALEAAPAGLKAFVDGMKETFKSEGAIPGKAGKVFRAPFQILEAGDAGTTVIGRAAELGKMAANEARRRGGTAAQIAATEAQLRANPPAGWASEITAKVKERQFKAPQTPDGLIEYLNKMAEKNPILEWVIPFRNTPGNVIKTALGRTPIGFKDGFKAYQEYKEAQRSGITGGALDKLKGEAVDKLTRPIAGSIVMGSLYAAAHAGAMVGSGPTDPKQAALWRRTGKQPYSFRVPMPDGSVKYVPFARFQPVSNLLMLAADAAEMKDAKKAGDLWDKGIAMAKASILNQPYLTGLGDVAQFLNDPKSGSAYVTSLASAAVPNIVNKAAQAIDPVYRDTTPSQKGLAGLPEKILNTWKSRIPGLSQTLPARRTATGDVDTREGSMLSRFASPIQITDEKPEAAVERLLLDADFTPSQPPRDFAVPGAHGAKVRLSDSEYSVLQESNRKAAQIIRQSYVNNPSFMRLDAESKKKALEKVYQSERDKAKAKLVSNSGFRRRALREAHT